MATHDNTYSRVIAWLKILLPLLALGLLSTLFLVARTVDPAQDLPFADVDVDELASQQRIGKPHYSAVTASGASVSVSAASALPDPTNPARVSGTEIIAGIDLTNGNRIDVTAATMQLDTGTGLAQLAEGVQIETSDGYSLRTQSAEIALDATRLSSNTPTEISAPIGKISADSFVLTDDNKGERPYVLVFKGHVKLVYDPNE